jgi:hypothetical protein
MYKPKEQLIQQLRRCKRLTAYEPASRGTSLSLSERLPLDILSERPQHHLECLLEKPHSLPVKSK